MKSVLVAVILAFFPLLPVFADEDQINPYEGVRLARLSYTFGEVLFQRGDDEEWIPSSINMPLRPHDKLWSTKGGRTELQFDDGTIVRLAENTNVDLLSLERGATQLQLTLGTATFITHSAPPLMKTGLYFEVDTPQAAILANRNTDFRVEVREDGSTEISVRDGAINLSTDHEPVVVTKGQIIMIDNNENPRYYLDSVGASDEWDEWNEERNREISQITGGQYLPPDDSFMGVSELERYGSWTQVPDYGWVWSPRVPTDWVPYRAGRWVWIEPWGWTWVSYEPWGWVPYHYGRWAFLREGWIWVPSPRREFWSPGHVRFIHGRDWLAWVPLAPGEPNYYRAITTPLNPRLINSNVPGATTILPRQAFITGSPFKGRFNPPADPIRSGRLISGPPLIVPQKESLRPRPRDETRTEILPPRVIHRPVIYDHTTPLPPMKFQDRVREIKDRIQHGDPPVRQKSNFRTGDVKNRERIRKDILVRNPIREPIRETPRSMTPPRGEGYRPPVKHIEPKQSVPGNPVETRPLYRKPPQLNRQREIR